MVPLKNKLVLLLVIASVGIWVSVTTLSGIGLAAVPIILVLLLDQDIPFFRGRPYRVSVSRRLSQPKVVEGERVLVFGSVILLVIIAVYAWRGAQTAVSKSADVSKDGDRGNVTTP